MEPITLTLLTLGGILFLNKRSKSTGNSNSQIPLRASGFLLTCQRIEIQNKLEFETFIKEVIERVSQQKKFQIITDPMMYLDFLESSYQEILKSFKLKCKPKLEDEKAIVFILKQMVSSEYDRLILKYTAKNNYEKEITKIVEPAINQLVSVLDLTNYKNIWDIFLYTGKYPNGSYVNPEDAGFSIGCSEESYIRIFNLEKFDEYLKNEVQILSNDWRFKDPRDIDFEKFIDEYLKVINNYCYWTFKQNTISEAGRKILYILIQYALYHYINIKYSTIELQNEYKKIFFDSEWKYLQKIYKGIDGEDIYELNETLRDQGEL